MGSGLLNYTLLLGWKAMKSSNETAKVKFKTWSWRGSKLYTYWDLKFSIKSVLFAPWGDTFCFFRTAIIVKLSKLSTNCVWCVSLACIESADFSHLSPFKHPLRLLDLSLCCSTEKCFFFIAQFTNPHVNNIFRLASWWGIRNVLPLVSI